MAALSLLAPFTLIDETYTGAFKLYLDHAVGAVQAKMAAPVLACVTLWIAIQGILVMRGDVDTRRSLTKLIMVAIVYGIVTSSSLYNTYVEDLFEKTVPALVAELGGDFGVKKPESIPAQLDLVFDIGEAEFIAVSKVIPFNDDLDSMAFEGAQLCFYLCLWTIFGIYDTINILMSVLITLGPLFIVGFLFESTRGITTRWIGQVVSYSILYLLTSVVAAAVALTIVLFMTATFGLSMLAKPVPVVGTATGQLLGLYEIDLFIMTGTALVAALPAIAANLGGGVAASGMQMGQSVYRRFAGSEVSSNTIRNLGAMQ
jgi:type IV secretion system protein VirB6